MVSWPKKKRKQIKSILDVQKKKKLLEKNHEHVSYIHIDQGSQTEGLKNFRINFYLLRTFFPSSW